MTREESIWRKRALQTVAELREASREAEIWKARAMQTAGELGKLSREEAILRGRALSTATELNKASREVKIWTSRALQTAEELQRDHTQAASPQQRSVTELQQAVEEQYGHDSSRPAAFWWEGHQDRLNQICGHSGLSSSTIHSPATSPTQALRTDGHPSSGSNS
eukprot:TRINITY_DN12074_c0_g2_i2.p2 TRINITY_DN12074_c0_g2~~TRINITY_DN12074_c0_g2_i2.p2  ORF type:complete len:165 (+),score=33.86 TRINITY_DN12074_c0_g2_i2:426-920(+)